MNMSALYWTTSMKDVYPAYNFPKSSDNYTIPLDEYMEDYKLHTYNHKMMWRGEYGDMRLVIGVGKMTDFKVEVS